MTYSEARAYIDKTARFGIQPGLERITKMMAYLGNPQDRLRFVHVAGTNGKGSTSTMIASILACEGYRTGLFTSPYVIDFRERFMINGEMISEDEFAAIMTRISTVNDILEKSGCLLTQFELITAVALLWFAQRECSVVVLECGLGGRLDSTNIIKDPLCSVITKISLDHTDILGDTIEAIAREKAGIIKPGCPTVLAPHQTEEALGVMASVCAERNSPLTICTTDAVEVNSMSPTVSHIHYGGLRLMFKLAGPHQIENAVTAVNAARVINGRGLPIREESIANGIAVAKIPARFEVLSPEPIVIVDGAHNPDGIDALCRSIDSLLGGRSIVGIIGMLADKDYENALRQIVPRFDTIFTVMPDNPRALNARELAACAVKYAGEGVTVKPVENLKKAAERGLEMIDEASALVVCGSLYLASEMRPILTDLLASEE